MSGGRSRRRRECGKDAGVATGAGDKEQPGEWLRLGNESPEASVSTERSAAARRWRREVQRNSPERSDGCGSAGARIAGGETNNQAVSDRSERPEPESERERRRGELARSRWQPPASAGIGALRGVPAGMGRARRRLGRG